MKYMRRYVLVCIHACGLGYGVSIPVDRTSTAPLQSIGPMFTIPRLIAVPLNVLYFHL